VNSFQDSAECGAPDLHATSDLGFANTGTMQFPDFRGVYGRGCRPTQPFPVFPRMGQTSPGSFP